MILAASKLDLTNKLDNDMFNHITYVSNRILLLSKREGISRDTLEEMGKYLWRLFRVFQAYNHKRKNVTLKEIIAIAKEFTATFE